MLFLAGVAMVRKIIMQAAAIIMVVIVIILAVKKEVTFMQHPIPIWRLVWLVLLWTCRSFRGNKTRQQEKIIMVKENNLCHLPPPRPLHFLPCSRLKTATITTRLSRKGNNKSSSSSRSRTKTHLVVASALASPFYNIKMMIHMIS